MATTTAQADVLVAVSDPAANAVLALADRLYWAAERMSRAEDQGWPREARVTAAREFRPLSDRYDALMAQIGDDDLYARVEATVWRDRRAEYAHAREVVAREQAA